MFPYRLPNSPPPPSQFRRPWSPEPAPMTDTLPENPIPGRALPGQFETDYPYDNRRRQASESSFEALDLGDYATALRHTGTPQYSPVYTSDRYPPFVPIGSRLDSPPPLAFSSPRTESSFRSPPSLVSAGSSAGTPSSQLHTPTRRPYSLPPNRSSYGHSHNYPFLVTPLGPEEPILETDLSQFPEWSRPWYSSPKHSPTEFAARLEPRLIDPSLPSYYNGSTSKGLPSSYGSGSNRDLLPWSDTDVHGGIVTADMKEERLRMLQNEFGSKSQARPGLTPVGAVGTVDPKGHIITDGPKKRLATRSVQGLFLLAITIASFYSALVLKPLSPPPPRGTLAAYLLYFLSVASLLVMLGYFVFRPCCCARKREHDSPFSGPPGMMVLPIQGLTGKNGQKAKKKGGKKGKGALAMDGVQVNLIVDPNALAGSIAGRGQEWGDASSAAGDQRTEEPTNRRRGIFEGLAMEQPWKQARSELKWTAFLDVALVVIWGAEFVIILIGKRCPSGQFQGWCDGYNVATALACFICIAFGFSAFFDIKDLHASRQSPRKRP